MNQKKKHILLYLCLVVVSGIGINNYWKVKNLKHELKHSIERNEILLKERTTIDTLQTLDALLLKGKYTEAFQAYQSVLEEAEKGQVQIVERRMALAKKLMTLQFQIEKVREENQDSLALTESLNRRMEATPEEVRAYDSLNFALKKAEVQLEKLKLQLTKKSFGEYLTFQSRKGNTVYYVGQVKDGMAHGQGVALLSTGSRYEGEWKANQRHGEGVFYWADGQYYEGGYQNDSRHGQGSYYWPNGDKFSGEWAKDLRNGEGTFYDKEGKIVAQGVWKDDELLGKGKKSNK